MSVFQHFEECLLNLRRLLQEMWTRDMFVDLFLAARKVRFAFLPSDRSFFQQNQRDLKNEVILLELQKI